jgi:hypothetical protein
MGHPMVLVARGAERIFQAHCDVFSWFCFSLSILCKNEHFISQRQTMIIFARLLAWSQWMNASSFPKCWFIY